MYKVVILIIIMNIDTIIQIITTKYHNNINIINTTVDKKTEVNSEVKTDINTTYSSDENLYKKPWAKLNIVHKIIKIKEYVNNLNISDMDKHIMKEKIINMVKTKTLKKDSINYDSNNGSIILII
jgi:protein tyrosine/serine phosphatase